MPRKIITAPHGAESVPDVPNYSWAEYGMRAGMPRILKLFADRGLPASTSINAGVIDAYPACAEAMLAAGWEFIGHGMHQKSMQAEEDEAGLIQAALDRLESFTGVRTRGWLSPGLKETLDNTRHSEGRGRRLCLRLGGRRPADLDDHGTRPAGRHALQSRGQ